MQFSMGSNPKKSLSGGCAQLINHTEVIHGSSTRHLSGSEFKPPAYKCLLSDLASHLTTKYLQKHMRLREVPGAGQKSREILFVL